MIPDTGERYLSTPLFEGVPADMSDEEKEIAASTPRFRFDVAAEPAKPAVGSNGSTNVKLEAREYIDQAIHGKDEPVVMFALEWCEFCWSVRKMFGELGVPYRSIDLDSVPFQENDWGGEIRAALKERTGSPTIPQIFIGGAHIGGCTETFDAYNDGRLQKLLEQSAVLFDGNKSFDAYSFLPGWLHPR